MTMKLHEGTAPVQDEPKFAMLDSLPAMDLSDIESKVFAAGLGIGKSGNTLGMMGLLYGMGAGKLKGFFDPKLWDKPVGFDDLVFLDHETGPGGLLQAYELKHHEMVKKYLDMPIAPAGPETPKAWEAKLPQEREPITKGFRSKLCKAKPGARAKAKAGRKARRR